jgi:hypothetical protein
MSNTISSHIGLPLSFLVLIIYRYFFWLKICDGLEIFIFWPVNAARNWVDGTAQACQRCTPCAWFKSLLVQVINTLTKRPTLWVVVTSTWVPQNLRHVLLLINGWKGMTQHFEHGFVHDLVHWLQKVKLIQIQL